MSNQKMSMRQKRRQAQAQLNKEQTDYRDEHFHKDSKGPTVVDPSRLSAYDKKELGIAPDYKFKDKQFVCEECGEIIDTNSVTIDDKEEVMDILFRMINQIKLFAPVESEEEAEEIVDLVKTLRMATNILWSFYKENILDAVGNDKKKNKGNNNNGQRRGNGGINIPASNFNRK